MNWLFWLLWYILCEIDVSDVVDDFVVDVCEMLVRNVWNLCEIGYDALAEAFV